MGWMDSDIDYINQIAQTENTTYAKLQVQETLGKRNLKQEVEELKNKSKNLERIVTNKEQSDKINSLVDMWVSTDVITLY